MEQVPRYLCFYLPMLSTILTDPQNSDPQTSRLAAENKPLQSMPYFSQSDVKCELCCMLQQSDELICLLRDASMLEDHVFEAPVVRKSTACISTLSALTEKVTGNLEINTSGNRNNKAQKQIFR